ncbi:15-hydroxyprostaglandin dehydrogenase [NAD(+)]-like [Genypterus blacodes]|uniref:15-hydroxyprostaglandin dehydrogenase [NAD(+)]-like n=1 Tax=Genypterus blacodes TaxID=154954 RepID=UPI003F75E8E4
MALSGKVAVVTGAAHGIGRAITEILLQNGGKVALLDINEAVGKSLKLSFDKQYGQDHTLFLRCDVQSEEQFKAAFQKAKETLGGIDIMFNNAGILDEDQMEKVIAINLTSVIKGTYMALDHMNKLTGGRGGVIINIASLSGLGPVPSVPVYTATKHGVVGFTRAVAAASALSGYGVRINALCPGFVQTDLFSSLPTSLSRFTHLAEAAQQLVDKLGVLDTSQVAKAVLDMVKDETKNGEALLVMPTGDQYVTFPPII